MLIRQIEVEGGFLDRLSISLVPGLNVLIGARGTGKTSLIELVRYALGAEYLTDAKRARVEAHAASVLGDGRVTLTAELGTESIVFTRAAGEPFPNISPALAPVLPTVLSQNEIEAVASDARGRLRLVDGVDSVGQPPSPDETVLSSIRSLSAEMDGIRSEIDSLEQDVVEQSDVTAQLVEARKQQSDLLEKVRGFENEQARLAELESLMAQSGVRGQFFDRVTGSLHTFAQRIAELRDLSQPMEAWPREAGEPDLVHETREHVQRAISLLVEAKGLLDGGISDLSVLAQSNTQLRITIQDEARGLRKTLEELSKGVGDASRRVASLQERVSQIEALNELLVSRKERLDQVGVRRGQLLDELETIRDGRSRQRLSTTQTLSQHLGPRIRLRLEKGGQRRAYETALADAMRGSGLHYNVLAPEIARETSPRELAEAVETGDVSYMVRTTGIGEERAQRLVAQVAAVGVGAILTAAIDDSVELSLLDGGEYKGTDLLSTGQRCTVILPILLARHRNLVIDQPEDNLDNAFVVETVVKAIKQHGTVGPDAQLLFATHNANIPVLGEAAKVVRLGSDGQHAFVLAEGDLESPDVVKAITDVMEGGRDAFRKRAAFYDRVDRRANGSS